MQRTKKSTLLSVLLVTVMVFAMIQAGALTSFAAGEINSFNITCTDYDASVAKDGANIPQSTTGMGFPVTITTEGVICPPESVYGGWYVEETSGDWQPAQGTFETGKKYAFRIDFDGISPKQGFSFATTMGAKVNGQEGFTWATANPWDGESGFGWLMSAPITIGAPTAQTFKAKSLWVSKHENTYVTFNWTGTPNNSLATAWDVQYRTKQIGTQYAWSKWIGSRKSGNTLSKRVYLKPNYTIEFKVKHETDTSYLRSVFTTPAGGKYQSITQCQVKVTATASGATFKKGSKAATALKVATNINGDSGNVITIKKGQSIKIMPNHVYPRTNFSKYPRLYPNHAWYDVGDSSKVSLTGKSSTAGMKDGAVTIRGLNAGTTTIKITSCNGRGATLTIVVK